MDSPAPAPPKSRFLHYAETEAVKRLKRNLARFMADLITAEARHTSSTGHGERCFREIPSEEHGVFLARADGTRVRTCVSRILALRREVEVAKAALVRAEAL